MNPVRHTKSCAGVVAQDIHTVEFFPDTGHHVRNGLSQGHIHIHHQGFHLKGIMKFPADHRHLIHGTGFYIRIQAVFTSVIRDDDIAAL